MFSEDDKSFFPNLSEKERSFKKAQFADAVNRSRVWKRDSSDQVHNNVLHEASKSFLWSPLIVLLTVCTFKLLPSSHAQQLKQI